MNLPSAQSQSSEYLQGAGNLRILNPGVLKRLGHIRHALFDFDGTLSVIREGWATVMTAFMLECMRGADENPALSADPDLERTVSDYVDQSTGTLTILQMKWLVQAVEKAGRISQVKTASEYKGLYVQRLLEKVQDRKTALRQGVIPPESLTVGGSRDFLAGLAQRGVRLYLASGTDHPFVVDEARCLGLEPFFGAHIYGAQEASEVDQKERIIRQIISENKLSGAELLVVGDGPVEIREGIKNGAITLGVASDEIRRTGWDEHKARRLAAAGADILVPDFSQWESLLEYLDRGAN